MRGTNEGFLIDNLYRATPLTVRMEQEDEAAKDKNNAQFSHLLYKGKETVRSLTNFIV
jgi:hypothetical protein